jgi:hypothetical protein
MNAFFCYTIVSGQINANFEAPKGRGSQEGSAGEATSNLVQPRIQHKKKTS